MNGPVNCSPEELSQYIDFLKDGFVPCVNSEQCTCSPGLGAESLQTCCSGTNPSVRSRSMNIASRSYQHGKKTVAFHGFQSLRMSRNLTDDRGAGLSISLPEGSPAKTFPWPEREPESKGSAAGCGESLPASLARFDPGSHSWRTAQPSLLGASEECSVIWPRSGMTVDGQCWELPMSARRTSVIGSGLWRTPTVSMLNADRARDPEYASRKVAKGQTITLADQVKNPVMWPTPRANDAEKRGDFDASNKRNGLPAAVKLWPTPTATLGSKGGRATPRKSREGGTLIEALSARRLWPTPTAMNSAGGSALCKWGGSGARAKLRTMVTSQELNGALNPAWVEWLMGWPIGWTSLAALHERECEYWQAANAAHGDGAPADELWFDEEAGAPSGDHGVRQAIPRVCSGVQARAARLKAIGNGQVPRAAAMAWRMLANILADLPTKTSSPVSVEI